ncbi:MAG: response regulator transcription factor [Salinivirgaceae bacterium]|nr:response regulator transcription factor [Salinivirgaceae bacterium]
MDTIRIALVDDHALFRNGLKLLLDNTNNLKVVTEAANGKEFVDRLTPDNAPDVVLMDISMPMMNGIEATREAIRIAPQMKIIALSMFGEEEYYYEMINAGAKGFLLKNSDIADVLNAIEQVVAGNSFFSQDILYNVIRKFQPHKEPDTSDANFSKRELQVLKEICKGLSNQEIADSLFISKRTVDKHRSNLLSKTNSKNTANLIMYAIKNKIISV